ncbi:MAG: sigma-54-dependent Fis family transcriptional regulator [candidate division Zixibacteria bacterium]|nr:sigma-54-dependent Fis family transcriptional regulator [candidate division Zixibacteria bacterium]
MKQDKRTAILISRDNLSGGSINWNEIGIIAEELPQLYQLIKERDISLVIVDSDSFKIRPAVASRIRRNNGLTEIWKLIKSEANGIEPADYLDGLISGNVGHKRMSDKINQILTTKDLLSSYGIVARSSKMKAVAETIRSIAPTDVAVLIVGPSGSGKELVASALHKDSDRSDKPFVAINCGALAAGLLESELFGHEKGAFTGSVGKRGGLFSKAEGGTLFLDEISETTPEMQVKLLRVLEDGTYYPVGSSTVRKADVRIVAATNRDLTEAISEKQFREDLYFRVSAIKIIVPSLLERKCDIQPLLHHFWQSKKGMAYTDSALELLIKFDWPGNVRQLKNFADRMSAFKPGGTVDHNDVEKFLTEQHSTARHLPVSTGKSTEEAGQELIYRAIISLGSEVRLLRDLITSNLPGEVDESELSGVQGKYSYDRTVEDMERLLIEQTLDKTAGNRKAAARRLGIGERTLYRKLKKYGLT